MSLFTETVTLVLAAPPTGTVDAYNVPIVAPPARREAAAWYEPASQSTDENARDQQVDAYFVYLPPSEDLAGVESVILFPGIFRVSGPPAHQPGGFINPGFNRLYVERVRG